MVLVVQGCGFLYFIVVLNWCLVSCYMIELQGIARV